VPARSGPVYLRAGSRSSAPLSTPLAPGAPQAVSSQLEKAPSRSEPAESRQVPGSRDAAPRRRGLKAKKTALASAATLVSINIWTGAPLLALWVGSRVEPSSDLSMGAVFVVIVVLAVLVFLLALILTRLNAAYDELTGRPQEARRASPWLRSLRGEREELRRTRVRSSAIEIAVMVTVVAAALTFEVWFFFFAHYSFQGM
jgi:uncharacterized membrane protein (DUF485 family)